MGPEILVYYIDMGILSIMVIFSLYGYIWLSHGLPFPTVWVSPPPPPPTHLYVYRHPLSEVLHIGYIPALLYRPYTRLVLDYLDIILT
jgi:hypothetical protein